LYLEDLKEINMAPQKLVLFFMIAGFCLAFSCASRRSEPVKQKEFASNSSAVLNGEKIYMLHCQKCHPAGEAGLGPAINSNPAPQFIKRFQMRHGLGVMPSFTKTELSSKELRDISKYLKRWKHY
jgi:mono/diheme cytochrome c family protein